MSTRSGPAFPATDGIRPHAEAMPVPLLVDLFETTWLRRRERHRHLRSPL